METHLFYCREPDQALYQAQVGLVDLLREEYWIVPAGMLGLCGGEIACGYADGALTREQTVRPRSL